MVFLNKNIIFVYGGDDFLVDRRARALYDSRCPDAEIVQYDPKGNFDNFIKNIYDALHSIPLFTADNNLWIRGVSVFYESDSTRAEALIDVLKGVDKDSIVILSASPVDKRKKGFKEILQLSDAEEVSDINEKSIFNFISDVCSTNGTKISPEASDMIQGLIGTDTRLLSLELEKLATYIHGDHEIITAEDVNALIEPTSAGDFFQQIEQFYSSDIDKTFDSLDRYFYFNHEARPLLIGLQNRTRLMIQLSALIGANLLSPNASLNASQLEKVAQKLYCTNQPKSSYNIFSQNPWYLSKLLKNTSRYSLSGLLAIQCAIMDAIAETAEKYDDQLSVMKKLAFRFKTLCAID